MIEVTLVDFFSFFYRSALVSFTQQLSVGNTQTGILFSLYRSYGYIIKNFKNVIFCFDGRMSKSLRQSQFANYKSHRKKLQSKYQELGLYDWKDIFLKTIPYYYATNETYEGDDVIATLTNQLKRQNYKINILTVDTDLWQLIEFGKVNVYDLRHKYRKVDSEYLEERFDGLKYPELIPVYKVIFGDPSDNIPKAIKPRTRKKPIIDYLNKHYESSVIKDIEQVLFDTYHEFRDKFELELEEMLAFLNIIRLETDISIDSGYRAGDKSEYENVCKRYHFKKVPKFDDFEYYLNRNSGLVPTVLGLRLEDVVDELL